MSTTTGHENLVAVCLHVLQGNTFEDAPGYADLNAADLAIVEWASEQLQPGKPTEEDVAQMVLNALEA